MTSHSVVALSWGEQNSDELAAPVHFQPRDPRDPSGVYIANDDYDESYSDSDSIHDSNHWQQLEAFGDELRASMATRRQTETRQRPRSWAWRPSRVLYRNRNRAVPESVQEENEPDEEMAVPTITERMEDGDGVEKSIRTVVVSDDGSVDEEDPITSAMARHRHRLASVFVVFPDPPSDEFHDEEEPPGHPLANSWEWNWKNLGRCISVIVVLEVFLVIGLLIAFLKEQ